MENTNEKFNKLLDEVIELGGDKAELEAWRKLWEFLDENVKEELMTNLSNQANELKNI